MNRTLLCLLVFVILTPAAIYFSYPLFYPTYVVRYRITVNAIAEGQQHSGSSVIEVQVKTQPRLLDSPPWTFRVTGGATFVDLGNGRNLIVFLSPTTRSSADAIRTLFHAFHIPFLVQNALALRDVGGTRELEPKDWPAFLTLPDVSDPSSAQIVDPTALGERFGSGVRVEKVTLTITQEPTTQSLPWLANGLSPMNR